jgi:hypothetical protein
MTANKFVGIWSLISCDALRDSGGVVPVYGKHPIGRLQYDAAGNMSVHIMKAGRPKVKSDTKFRATAGEMRAAYEGYEAYFSTYWVDETRNAIHHRVIGGLFPNWTGTVQTRFYKFEGDKRLILSTDPVGAKPGTDAVVILVWERVP